MESKSPICEAIKQIIDLFDFNDEVEVISYKDNFENLWSLKNQKDTPINGKKIWCVIDDYETPLNWLPAGIWARYYRSKNRLQASRIVLVGRSASLDPPHEKESIYVPEFYKDEGLNRISLDSKNGVELVVKLIESIKDLKEWQGLINEANDDKKKEELEKDLAPDEEIVKAWQRLVYAILSSPEKRHSISNEIAPMVLRDALLKQKKSDNKAVFEDFEREFKLNNEQKALLELWKWSSGFISSENHKKRVNIKNILGKDIWDVWSEARFLLVDDQAVSHGYEQILQSVLRLLIGDKVSLTSQLNLPDIDKIQDYQCLFLDLRLNEEDAKVKDYGKLPALKFAVKLSNKDPSFPIIIFSSSQKREIDKILSPYKNIITCFRKPGIAGSLEALDGLQSLDNLFKAISEAIEMIENRLVWQKMENVSENLSLCYKVKQKSLSLKNINFDRKLKRQLFNAIFQNKRYDLAFTFPYSFFEFAFSEDYKRDFNYIRWIGIKEKSTDIVTVDNGSIDVRIQEIISLVDKTNSVKLGDLEIMQGTPNLNLHLRGLNQLRNMAAHGIRNFYGNRREAIVVFLLFLDTLINNRTSAKDKKEYRDLGVFELESNEERVLFPLSRTYPLNHEKVTTFLHEIIMAICYYGKDKRYKYMYALLKNSLNKE